MFYHFKLKAILTKFFVIFKQQSMNSHHQSNNNTETLTNSNKMAIENNYLEGNNDQIDKV